MKSSETYCIRFYVALGDGVGYAIKNIQAVLTIDSLLYNDPNYGYIPGVNPALEADSVLTDTVNWTRVQMSYTAAGGEQFLTIGNFSPGDSTEFSILGVGYYSYYILDDFSVYKQPRCFAGNDTTILPGDSVQLGILGEYEPSYSWVPTIYLTDPNIANPIATPPSTITYTLTVTDTNQLACNPVQNDYITIWVSGVGIDENGNTTHSGELWPNPAENSCTYKLDLKQNQEAELFLNDLLGRTVQRHTLSGQKNRIEMNLSELDAGVYFIKVLIEGNLADSQKLIIQ